LVEGRRKEINVKTEEKKGIDRRKKGSHSFDKKWTFILLIRGTRKRTAVEPL